ncbi:Na-translocating system protein MpsC family protein [Ornithinibacillus caprae]|uniref:Na-translocating system protein MpsC family protein n=1 Tax=Ornithinibacillus caprae TaxID=2678566 RepID=UPI001FE601E8|nr:Na-translocating system protein MpsC family protein [Ornithinibacillus caprae]
MNTENVQKELASYIGRLLRDNFGRGPETVFVSIRKPYITVYLRNFFSPMEKVMMEEKQETYIQTSRDILMKSLIPEIKAYMNVLTGESIGEFYYDWNLHNRTGMFVAISTDPTALDELSNMDFAGKKDLFEEINNIGQQAQKVPEEVLSYKLNERTIIVIRTGLFITIERELIRMGQSEILRTAKRKVEKRLLHNNMRLESILDAKIDDSFVSWDFERDKSVILFIINPNQKGGNELDK